jgi:hypothetical protein
MSKISFLVGEFLMPQQPRAKTGTPSDASAAIGVSERTLAKNGDWSRLACSCKVETRSIRFLLSLPSMTHSTASQPS